MVVFLGSYYLLNLMLAVVTMSYEAEANVNDQVIKHKEFEFLIKIYLSNFCDLIRIVYFECI